MGNSLSYDQYDQHTPINMSGGGAHHLVKLSSADYHVKPGKLLCNWPKCTAASGKKAVAERLCPYCHCAGYCCTDCMDHDIDRHVTKECQQNIKKAVLEPQTKLF